LVHAVRCWFMPSVVGSCRPCLVHAVRAWFVPSVLVDTVHAQGQIPDRIQLIGMRSWAGVGWCWTVLRHVLGAMSDSGQVGGPIEHSLVQ
jgi:hypothetical protein